MVVVGIFWLSLFLKGLWKVWRLACGRLTAVTNLLCVIRCLMGMYLDSYSELCEPGINWSLS